MKKDEIYFGENGLTSTSANFVANQAKEYVQTLEEELKGTSFLDGQIGLVGGKSTSVCTGVRKLDYVVPDLDAIVQAHSLIAWLREALKAKQTLAQEVRNMNLEDWCKSVGKEFPVAVQLEPTITEDEILATWSIKERNAYLALGARVATYGKFIHPSGQFANARKELKKRVNEPVTYTESGRDTLIKSYKPSMTVKAVDDKFFEIQSIWRKAQAELNGYSHKIQQIIDEDSNKKYAVYTKAMEARAQAYNVLNAEFAAYKEAETQRISQLKIIIPNDLQSIYNLVNSLSK